MLPVIWIACAAWIIVSAVRVQRGHPSALRQGRIAVGVLYLGAGAAVNTVFLARGDDYREFADGAYVDFVTDTWRSLVVPDHHLFIGALVVFELLVGILVLRGGRATQVAYVLALGFHVALLSFGWGFYLWSVPMLVALSVLLRGELRVASGAAVAQPHGAAGEVALLEQLEPQARAQR